MTEVTRTALHRTDVSLRHYCRHPKCRSKLPEPVDIDRGAFCSRGCYVDFYRRHCLVCEAEIPLAGLKRGRTHKAAYCSERCGTEGRRNPEAYAVPAALTRSRAAESEIPQNQASNATIAGAEVSPVGVTPEIAENANEMGPEIAPLPPPTPAVGWRGSRVPSERRWAWESSAGGWSLVDGRGDTRARVAFEGDRGRVIWPRAIPATEGKDLQAIKAAAVSLALAAIPFDKATQARVRAAERELAAATGR